MIVVNDAPERFLALFYAPTDSRAGLIALLALDARLGDIVRSARKPLIGQMRLTWWHEALVALDTAPPPAEPLLMDLAREVLPRGVGGAMLASQVEGWETLLDGELLDRCTLSSAARARGGSLFASAATVLHAADPRIAKAGEGWALADFAFHLSDSDAASLAREMAAARLDEALAEAWPRALRSLGALALSARADLRGVRPVGHPARVGRLAWHRLTGR